MNDGATIVFARDVFGGVNSHHTMGFQDGFAVNAVANQFAMGHWRLDDGRVKRARQLGHVIGESGTTCDVQMRRFVNDIGALLQTRRRQ